MTRAAPTLAVENPAFFGIRGTDAAARGEGFGTCCGKCGREISAPHRVRGRLVWCLYCGMAEGHVPMIELPWPMEFTFGITWDECRAIDTALRTGGAADADAWCYARALERRQIIEMFR